MKQIFSIYDKKGQCYLSPIVLSHKGQALRELENLVVRSQNLISQYPDDFAMYKLGDFDDISGKIVPTTVPIFIEEAGVFAKTSPACDLNTVASVKFSEQVKNEK